MTLNIGIIGAGTVGNAQAHAWADHTVRVWDSDSAKCTASKIDTLSSDLVFVCLPEAAVEPFFNDMSYSYQFTNFIIKSTVPIGTTKRIAKERGLHSLVHSPEFLTERTAEYDATHPSVNIIGVASGLPTILRTSLQFQFPNTPTHVMTSDESEAVKLFQNAFFAVKIAAFNELRLLAYVLHLDWDVVRNSMLADGRISEQHTLVPGPDGKCGFGGKCLPKDVLQLADQFHENALYPRMLLAALARNLTDRDAK